MILSASSVLLILEVQICYLVVYGESWVMIIPSQIGYRNTAKRTIMIHSVE